MRFLKGNVLFFALLLLAIMLFTYYAIKEMDVQDNNVASCRVFFTGNYADGACEVYIGDSLLYAGEPLPVDSQIVMKRYAADNSKKSLYTSKSLLKVVAGGDTASRTLDADRLFAIDSHNGKVVVVAVEK